MAEITNSSTSEAITNKDNVVTPDDKQVLIDDLKKTMHDMGRIPAILMAPVIAYVSSQYDKIPESRRTALQTIVTTLKTKGIHGLAALKTWFAEASTTAPATNANTDTPATTVTTPSPVTTVAPPPVVKTAPKKTPATIPQAIGKETKMKKEDTKKATRDDKKTHKSQKKKEKKGK